MKLRRPDPIEVFAALVFFFAPGGLFLGPALLVWWKNRKAKKATPQTETK